MFLRNSKGKVTVTGVDKQGWGGLVDGSSQMPEHEGPCSLGQGLQDFPVSETMKDHFWFLCAE